jgi:hypothetical protein
MTGRFLVSVAVVLATGPLASAAQPLFRFDHDWTVTIGGRLYGLREVVQTPGDFRWTQVWVGRSSFDVRLRAAEVLAFTLFRPAAPLAVDRTLVGRLRRGT